MTIKAINENTSLPLKVIIPICICIGSCTWFISNKINDINNDTWTVENMSDYREQAMSLNEDLNLILPEPYSIKARTHSTPTNRKRAGSQAVAKP